MNPSYTPCRWYSLPAGDVQQIIALTLAHPANRTTPAPRQATAEIHELPLPATAIAASKAA